VNKPSQQRLPVIGCVHRKRKLRIVLVLLSQKVAAVAVENQVIEEIQDLVCGGPDESRSGRR
jgi:hypothetical protein